MIKTLYMNKKDIENEKFSVSLITSIFPTDYCDTLVELKIVESDLKPDIKIGDIYIDSKSKNIVREIMFIDDCTGMICFREVNTTLKESKNKCDHYGIFMSYNIKLDQVVKNSHTSGERRKETDSEKWYNITYFKKTANAPRLSDMLYKGLDDFLYHTGYKKEDYHWICLKEFTGTMS